MNNTKTNISNILKKIRINWGGYIPMRGGYNSAWSGYNRIWTGFIGVQTGYNSVQTGYNGMQTVFNGFGISLRSWNLYDNDAPDI